MTLMTGPELVGTAGTEVTDSQSSQETASVLSTGWTQMVSVMVDRRVMVVVGSIQSPQVWSGSTSVVGAGLAGTVVSQSAQAFSSVEVVGATGTLEVVDVQSSHGSSALVVEVRSAGLADVVVEAQSSQGSSVLEEVVVMGSTGLLEVVDDSQSAHEPSLSVVVEGETGTLEVVDDSQSAQEPSLSVVEGETGTLDVVVVSGHPPLGEVVVVVGATGAVVVVCSDHPPCAVVLVTGSTSIEELVESQSTQVSRACSFACMCLAWLAALTEPMTAAPAAAIVTALMVAKSSVLSSKN